MDTWSPRIAIFYKLGNKSVVGGRKKEIYSFCQEPMVAFTIATKKNLPLVSKTNTKKIFLSMMHDTKYEM